MSGQLVGQVVVWLIVAIVVIAVVVWLLNWLYHRSTKEVSFVRTGFGGEKVVINGGALVLPIIHEVTPVAMNVSRLRLVRERDKALITRDRMRVDIDADFYVRVKPTREGVSAAATTLGRRMMQEDGLNDLLEGKFVSVLRAVAAELTLDEMHERRAAFVDEVASRSASMLEQNGLELESAAITDLDQTDLEFFNPANRFDAEGLTTLITTIEERRKIRNDIEQSSLLQIRARNLQAEQESLDIEKQSTSSRLSQEREIEEMRAAQQAEVTRVQAERQAEATAARITSEQATSAREIVRRRSLQEAEITAEEEIQQRRILQERTIELARIERQRAVRESEIADRTAIEAAEVAAEQDLRAKRIAAEESMEVRDIERTQQIDAANIASRKEVDTARIAQELAVETARIEREKTVKSMRLGEQQATAEAEISSREDVERARIASDRSLEEARILFERDRQRLEVERALAIELAEIEKEVGILKKRAEESAERAATASAEAKAAIAQEAVETGRETEVAKRIAAVDRLMAEKDAETARIAAETDKINAVVKAEAERLMNEADNMLTDEARAGRLRGKVLERLEGIIRESVRPLDKIEGIKIVQMGGLMPNGGEGQGQSRSPTDEVIDSALRFRAQAPLIDEMMKEIGVPNANVAKMGDIFRSAKDAAALAKGNVKSGDED